jgi:rfaE bifunctional protein kinase chain/domain
MKTTHINQLRVLVVGDIILDRYVHSTTTRLSSEAPVPILRPDKTEHRLGGAANVARQCAAFGCETHLVGITGKDGPFATLCDLFDESGIGYLGVFHSERRPTTVKTRFLGNGHQVMRLDEEVNERDHGDEVHPRLLSHLERTAHLYDVIIVQDYGKGVVDFDLLEALLDRSKKDRVLVADPTPDSMGKFEAFDYVTPNEREFREYHNLNTADRGADRQAANRQIHDSCLKGVLVTRGAGGVSIYYDDDMHVGIKAAPVVVRDVTGAGDTAVAAFAVVLAASGCLMTAVRAANHAGAAVVQQQGCGVATVSDILPGEYDDAPEM